MDFEIRMIIWLQEQRTAFLDFLFETITMLGEEPIIIAILGFVFWSVNKIIGKRLAITVFISVGLNSILKIIFGRLRPFQVNQDIINLRPETSYSYAMPSGHTQSAATIYFGLAYFFKKKSLWIIATILTVLVALSRMYLGVHYLTDVLVGGLLALGVIFLLNKWLDQVKKPNKIYFIIGYLSLLVLLIFVIIKAITISDAHEFFLEIEQLAKMIGALNGFILGIYLEERYVNFNNHKILYKNILRFIIGIVLVFAVRLSLKAIFDLIINPDSISLTKFQAIMASLLDYLRYAVMVVFGIGIYPRLFKTLKI